MKIKFQYDYLCSLFAYFSPIFFVGLAIGWLIIKRDGFVRSNDMHLNEGIEEIERHEESILKEREDTEIAGWKKSIHWLF